MVYWEKHTATMGKRYSEELKEEARRLYDSGLSVPDVGRHLGCRPQNVRYWCDPIARAKAKQRTTIKSRTRSTLITSVKEDSDVMTAFYCFVDQFNQKNGTDYEVDHILDVRLGGQHEISNLRMLPRSQNRTGRPKRKVINSFLKPIVIN